MTIEEALEFFEDIPAIYDRLKTMGEVGLDYLKLGQSATTLSGGEAQRIKIASELYRPHLQKTIYLLDEPTVGLHYEDVQKLIDILNRLVDAGNSVVLIEHNMDVIKSADYLLDFGPEGGVGGGKLVAKGTPEEVANNKNSHTGCRGIPACSCILPTFVEVSKSSNHPKNYVWLLIDPPSGGSLLFCAGVATFCKMLECRRL
jgi:excinuclease ABC subunit A